MSSVILTRKQMPVLIHPQPSHRYLTTKGEMLLHLYHYDLPEIEFLDEVRRIKRERAAAELLQSSLPVFVHVEFDWKKDLHLLTLHESQRPDWNNWRPVTYTFSADAYRLHSFDAPPEPRT